jgi:hypothetical protein
VELSQSAGHTGSQWLYLEKVWIQSSVWRFLHKVPALVALSDPDGIVRDFRQANKTVAAPTPFSVENLATLTEAFPLVPMKATSRNPSELEAPGRIFEQVQNSPSLFTRTSCPLILWSTR